jgi:tetratricopeptide (TPR) repeat protein
MHTNDPFIELTAAAAQGRMADVSLQAQALLLTLADAPSLLQLGALLFHAGLLTLAQAAFSKGKTLVPNDHSLDTNLANIERDQGQHHLALLRYQRLLTHYPNDPIIRRNYLTSLEYDLTVSDEQRRAAAQDWGKWAIARAGGYRPRPKLSPLSNRALRIGYVSADFCQHTVGWLIQPVIQHHHTDKVTVFTYSATQLDDHITHSIRQHSQFRDVRKLNDAQLATRIREDKIDVLIDLSGHTAGSRLNVFAHRPAPVQVSWLGYFASTGLSTIDAVLLDKEHAPAAVQNNFTESIIRLPNRWCYQPVFFAPEVSPVPVNKKGLITFGSFNNTAKYNADLFTTWAAILHAVPNSRLILKWRTYNDERLKQDTLTAFAQQGIDPKRIELRAASFHANLLAEYSDIDIALDPFPFTGGMTSLEALWMGVPVITHPMSRVVSRQTHAILHQIGLAELSAETLDDYIQNAVKLAKDTEKLNQLRQTLRQRMQSATLMDAQHITNSLEAVLINLYQHTYEEQQTMSTINIDGKDYPLESLSDQAKAELQMVQFTDQEIARLTALLMMAQTARNTYANALQAALPKEIQ